MRARYTLISAALILSPLMAQEQRPSFMRMHPLLSALDADQNGSISAAELKAAPAALAKLDANKDGSITREEMRPAGFGPGGPGGRGPGGPGGGPGENRGPGGPDMVATLMAFDANKDGKIAKSEMPERMMGLFERADADKDGFLTSAEITAAVDAQAPRGGGDQRRGGERGERGGPGGPDGRGGMMMDPIMAALDTDHDGAISKSEVAASATSLKALDKNGDGAITEDEVRPNFGGGRGGPRPEGERR